MKENRLATIIKKDMLKKADKLDIDKNYLKNNSIFIHKD